MNRFYFETDPDTFYAGIDAGTWNGWAVPILSDAEYAKVKAVVDEGGVNDPYEGTKVDGGWLCDGLCFYKAPSACVHCGVEWKGGFDMLFFDEDEVGFGAICMPCSEKEQDPEVSWPEDEEPEESPRLDPPWWAYK